MSDKRLEEIAREEAKRTLGPATAVPPGGEFYYLRAIGMSIRTATRYAAEMVAERDAEIARLRRELEEAMPLARYGLACVEESREALGDLDGGWLQDKAVECGVLVEVEVTEPCGESCRCAEWDDFPQTCYRYSEAVEKFRERAAVRRAREREGKK